MKEMSQSAVAECSGWATCQKMYNLVVNTNSELATSILNNKDKDAQESLRNKRLT
jgi:molecular chaperone HtpG